MLLRLLSICLATVLLSSILLFIYFRTKVAKVEEKLEIMFNLIQSHAEQKVNTNSQVYHSMQQQEQMIQESNRVNLIDVSDNEEEEEEEEESDSEDSETDNDENGNLVIDEELMKEENIKKIELKVENSDVLFNHLEEAVDDVFVQKNDENEGEVEEEEEEEEKDEEGDDENLGECELDLSKLKVSELKDLCSEKGMSGYKKLKKQELINLLQH